jgi:hypothetical protein
MSISNPAAFRLNLAIVAANNHYAGFGSGSAIHSGKYWIYQK